MAETKTINSKLSTAQLRKIKKPMIEKRRRCRINESLNQLKSLVLEALNKDESRYSKMEKADILEMTVRHLKAVQKQQVAMTAGVAMTTGQDPYVKYRAGYSECAREIGKCLNQMSGVSSDVQSRLLQHLEKVGQPKATPTATPMTSLPGSPPFVISTPLGMTPMTQPLSVAVPPVVAVMSPAPVLPSSDSQNLNLNSAIPLYISPRAGSSPGTTSPALSTTSTTLSRSGTPNSTCVHSPQAGEEVPQRFRDMCSPPQSVYHSSELTRTSPIIVQPSLEVKDAPVWRPW